MARVERVALFLWHSSAANVLLARPTSSSIRSRDDERIGAASARRCLRNGSSRDRCTTRSWRAPFGTRMRSARRSGERRF
jgi:hypothetical protein